VELNDNVKKAMVHSTVTKEKVDLNAMMIAHFWFPCKRYDRLKRYLAHYIADMLLFSAKWSVTERQHLRAQANHIKKNRNWIMAKAPALIPH